jgi:hypothetical protein
LRESDVAALYTMGLHSVLLNTYCRTAGYCRNDYRKILEEPAATQVEEGAMADIVMAYCSSHGPMMAAARDAAPSEQGDAFFGAERRVRDLAAERGVQALVAFLNHQGHFAMAEAIANLARLRRRGEVEQLRRTDGTFVFTRR